MNRKYSVAGLATLVDLAEGNRAVILEAHLYTKMREDILNSCSVIHTEKV